MGYHNTDAVLEHVEFKDPAERTEAELFLYDDLQELKRINDVIIIDERSIII